MKTILTIAFFGFLSPFIFLGPDEASHWLVYYYGELLSSLGMFTTDPFARDNTEVIQNLPAMKALLQGADFVIDHELKPFLKATMDYHVSLEDYNLVDFHDEEATKNLWTHLGLSMGDKYSSALTKYAPVFKSLLDNLEEEGFVFYSTLMKLEAGRSIPWHRDISGLFNRIHLPLEIKGDGEINLKFKDPRYRNETAEITTKVNEAFFFRETTEHMIENNMKRGHRINLMIVSLTPVKNTWLAQINAAIFRAAMSMYNTDRWSFAVDSRDEMIKKLQFPIKASPSSFVKFMYDETFSHKKSVDNIKESFRNDSTIKPIFDSYPIDQIDRLIGYMVTLHHSRLANLYVPTMLSGTALGLIQTWTTHVVENNIPGGFLEAGVWRGGGSIFMKHMSNKLTEGKRPVYLLDSFEGMEDIQESDMDLDIDMDRTCAKMLNLARDKLGSRQDIITTSEQEVRGNFHHFLGPNATDNVVFLKGWFGERFPWEEVGQLAILRLDVDYYKPTRVALEKLYDKLSVGGVVILDEYYLDFMGEQMAVDEFRASRGITSPLIRSGSQSAFWVKLHE